MFEFIENHKKVFLFTAIIIVVALVIGLLILDKTQKTPNANTNTDINEPNYSFLKKDITEQEKYLMLQGKISTEEYGTYSDSSAGSLVDLQNQSTDNFKAVIQNIIESISPTTDVKTVVDAESIKLEHSGYAADVTMNAIKNNDGNETNIASNVHLVKQGDYWLVDNITITNR